ncbi:MAG: hypothetical protein ACKOJF_27145, partial [Planctomycetaceae bacterium]
PRSSLLAGVLLGLLALCRSTFLASAAVWGGLACMAAMRRRAAEGGGPVPLRALLALCGGLAVVLLPWGIRNQRQFGHPMVTTSHGGYTLRLAQNPRYAGLVALTSNPAGWRAYNQVLADEGYAWMFSPERSKGTVGLSRSTAGRLAYSGPIDHWEIDSDAALQRLAVQHLGQSPSLAWATARSLLGRLWSPWPRQADSWPAVARWALGSEQLLLFAAAAAGLSIWSWSAGWRGVGPGRIGMPTAVEPIPRQAIPGRATPVDERHFENTTEGRARAEVAAVSAVGRLAVALLLSFTLVHSVYWADMRMRAPLVPVLALLAARAGVALLEKWRRPRGGGQPG